MISRFSGVWLTLFVGARYTGSPRRNKMVSFLSAISMVGLVVGVALLLTVLSVMNGFDRELRLKILRLVPQAAIYNVDGIDNWQGVVHKVVIDSDVVAAAPFVQLEGLVSYRGEAEPVNLYGVDPDAESDVSLVGDFLEGGQGLEVLNADASLYSSLPAIFLGRALAVKLGIEVGAKLTVVVPGVSRRDFYSGGGSGNPPEVAYFKVAGLIASNTELDNVLAITSLKQAALLSGLPERVSGVRLKVNDLFNAPSIVYRNLQRLGDGFYGTNWTRTHGNLYHAIKMSKNLVGLLMSLIVAIAAFNVVATLIMVVVDKEADIAILRTLGFSSRGIMGVFVVQGAIIGLFGTLIGVSLGCLLSLSVGTVVQCVESLLDIQFLKSDVYPLTYLPTEILLSDVVRVTTTALVLSFLATLYPAWKASRVQPAEALRYE